MRFALLHIIFLSLITSNVKATNVVAEIPTTYDVNRNGAFEYSLPLRIPPGIGDMIPSLAITYNSQAGNSILGMGWSISGLSSITRSVPNIYNDKIIEPVDFNNDDVFLLDGQRLFETTPGSRIYMTEEKNFAIIELHTPGTSTEYFTVTYPNGMVYEYGNTILSSTSAMLASGSTSKVLIWALSKVTDRNGNSIKFEYYNINTTGDYRIRKISYAHNDNMSLPSAQIIFNYMTRQDANTVFVDNSMISSGHLLSDIEIKHPSGDIANKYEFSYHHDFYAHLVNITEKREGLHPLPIITINWHTGSQEVTPHSSTLQSTTNNSVKYVGDFNGDGYTDFVRMPILYGVSNFYDVYINDKNNGFTLEESGVVPVPAGYSSTVKNRHSTPYGPVTFDWNGNGYDDFIFIATDPINESYSIILYETDPNATQGVFKNPVQLYTKTHTNTADEFVNNLHILPGDYDGDGKNELIVIEPQLFSSSSTQTVSSYFVRIFGVEYSQNLIGGIAEHIDGTLTLDYNGDGRTDILYTNISQFNTETNFIITLDVTFDANYKPVLSTTSSKYKLIGLGGFTNTWFLNWTGDFNGDGKTDMISFSTAFVHTYNIGYPDYQWYIAYSKGRQVATPAESYKAEPMPSSLSIPPAAAQPPTVPFTYDPAYLVADYNGDGKDDILYLKRDGSYTNYILWYSKGYREFESISGQELYYKLDPENVIVGDFNADGQADIMSENDYDRYIYYFRVNQQKHLVKNIVHAGKTLEIEYSPITQDQDYASFSPTANNYPNISRPIPIKVVKRLYDNVELDNRYTYTGLTHDLHGRGILGFYTFKRLNAAGQDIKEYYDFWSTRIPYLEYRHTLFDLYADDCNGITERFDAFEVPGGCNGNSLIVYHAKKTWNCVEGITTIESITPGNTGIGSVFYEFGQPEAKQKEVITTATLPGTTTYLEEYTYDATAPFYTKSYPTRIKTTDVIRSSNPYIRTTDYTYDNQTGMVKTVTRDPSTTNELTTEYFYDYMSGTGVGNVERVEISWPGLGTPKVTDEYTYVLNDPRFVLSHTNELGYVEAYKYDGLTPQKSWGNVVIKHNINDLETIYEYDEVNRLTKTILPTGIEETITYDWASNHSTHAPSVGVTPRFCTVGETSNISGKTYNYFDIYDRSLRSVSPAYDGSYHLYSDKTYNNVGLIETVTTAYPSNNTSEKIITSYTYDQWNRQTESESEYVATSNILNSTSTSYTTYDYQGHPYMLEKSVTDNTSGRINIFAQSGDFLFEQQDMDNFITYTYHGSGQHESVEIDASGSQYGTTPITTTYQYDNYGHLTTITEPNAGATTYTYNVLGEVLTETDANGDTWEYTYDVLGRVIEKLESGQSTPYTYDYYNVPNDIKTGTLTQKTAPNGSKTIYTYYGTSGYGRLQTLREEVDPSTFFETSYTYDIFGRVKQLTYPSSDVIEHYYSSFGHLESIDLVSGNGIAPQNIWKVSNRDYMGHVTKEEYKYDAGSTPTSLYTIDRAYDIKGHNTELVVNNNPNLALLSHMSYMYDVGNSNLTTREDITDPLNTLSETFVYQTDYDRLIEIQGLTPPSIHIDYDELGNIRGKTDATTSGHYWRYNDYALTKVPEPTTTNTIPLDLQNVTYTPFKKVQNIHEDGHTEYSFMYGPNEERIKMEYRDHTNFPTITHTKTKYYATNYEKIIDPTGSGDETDICYVWADGKPVAMIKHDILGLPNPSVSDEIYFLITDYLGSINQVLDNTGNTSGTGLVEQRSFDAWGRSRDPLTWVSYTTTNHPVWMTDRGFTGHEHIWMETSSSAPFVYNNNIINMNGRLYAPLVGRMFSPDPIVVEGNNSQSYNKYTYALNNPLKYTDPSGYSYVQQRYNTGQNTSSGSQTYTTKDWIALGISIVSNGIGGYIGNTLATAWGPGLGKVGGHVAGHMTGGWISGTSKAILYNQDYNGILKSGFHEALGGASSGLVAAANAYTPISIEEAQVKAYYGKDWTLATDQAGVWAARGSDYNETFVGTTPSGALWGGNEFEMVVYNSGEFSSFSAIEFFQVVKTNDPIGSRPMNRWFIDSQKPVGGVGNDMYPFYNSSQMNTLAANKIASVGINALNIFYDKSARMLTKKIIWQGELSIFGQVSPTSSWQYVKSFRWGWKWNPGMKKPQKLPFAVKVKPSPASSARFDPSWK